MRLVGLYAFCGFPHGFVFPNLKRMVGERFKVLDLENLYGVAQRILHVCLVFRLASTGIPPSWSFSEKWSAVKSYLFSFFCIANRIYMKRASIYPGQEILIAEDSSGFLCGDPISVQFKNCLLQCSFDLIDTFIILVHYFP